jgi:tRNA (cmo5U34)-methyltransferase
MDENLKNKFDQNAESYNKQRTDVIPNLKMMYTVMADLATTEIPNPKILDLGAGTGLLTATLLKKYPQGYFTLIDFSEKMLSLARKRFNDAHNFKYIHDDYLKADFKEHFDIIVSSLSIHHIEDQHKKFLYSKIFKILNEGGIFLNADQVLAPSSKNEYIYQKNWYKKIEEGNLKHKEKELIIDRMKFDRPATLKNNLTWLEKSGFTNVDVFYKFYNFCVLYGKKQSTSP